MDGVKETQDQVETGIKLPGPWSEKEVSILLEVAKALKSQRNMIDGDQKHCQIAFYECATGEWYRDYAMTPGLWRSPRGTIHTIELY